MIAGAGEGYSKVGDSELLNLESFQQHCWGANASASADPEEKAIALATAATLRFWSAPVTAVQAALVLPLMSPARREMLHLNVSHSAVQLAQRLVERRASLAMGPGEQVRSAWLSSNLSRMYRDTYLDLPDLSFTLLFAAHHDALVSRSTELKEEEAYVTQGVFSPFAEMLGLWSLYRRWVEKSYAVLFPVQYQEMQKLMGTPEDYSEESFERMIAGGNGLERYKSTNLLDKAAAFISLKKKLNEKFIAKELTATVELITNFTGLALRRVREKESREDVAQRLGVRIICNTVDECYSALGILHSLGRPVSFSSILHFQDHIASPQPNGYQALQAAITYTGYAGAGAASSMVVECRIMTREMLELNENGVVVAGPNRAKARMPPHAWWNKVSTLSTQLSKMLDERDCPSIYEFLSAHNLGSLSDPLYVFTPRGEIVLLPQGSTPLDFAYRIHSEMGHHALRVDVNGQSVPHGYLLRNGDIVRVHYDSDYAGPDISWLSLVATNFARVSIRRKLAARARAAHEGRASVEDALLKALDRFQREKRFDLNVTTDRLEGFLNERASFYGFSDVTGLYSRLADNNEFAERLVGELLSSELSANISAANGEKIQSSFQEIRICRSCLPVPGDSIVGYQKSGKSKLTVHRDGDQNCLKNVNDKYRTNLNWSAEAFIDQKQLLVFSITADDRQGLLREVLDAVYRTEEAYLYKVEATTSGDRQAKISLVVRADTFDRFAEIETVLSTVAGMREIRTAPPSPSQRATLVADPLHIQPPRQHLQWYPNPYTSEEVYQRDIFYDRQDLLDSLLKWLQEPPPIDAMILHGQRRVGKTSLVKYLMLEYLPPYRLVQTVFVTLQSLSEFHPHNLAGLIVRGVFKEIRQTAPSQEFGEEPMEWLGRALDEARRFAPRLLIIIDELNVLIDLEREGKAEAVLYNNLRSVMNSQRSVNWLLVVQDTHFFDRDMWRGAGILLQKARKLSIKHLDKDWTRRLVLEPTRRCGLAPQDEQLVIDEVLRLTAGSPFLIQLICLEIVDQARRHHRSVITRDSLKAASEAVKHEGQRWFFHFLQNLKGLREIVMAAVSVALGAHNSVDEMKIIHEVRTKASEISPKAIRQTLVRLAQEGLIAVHTDGKTNKRQISIPIGLFKNFLESELDVDRAVQRWLGTNGRRRRMKTNQV